MLIVMKKSASEQDLRAVKNYLVERDFDFHQSTGADRTILGVIGDTGRIEQKDLRGLSGVLEVFKIPAEE